MKNKVKTQHNMCRTQLCTKTTTPHASDTTLHKHNTTCVGHNFTQKHNTTCVGHNFTQRHNTTCVGHNYAQKHNTTCVGHNYTPTNTNNVSKTWTLLQTKGGKDEHNIVLMRKSQRTSQDGTLNIKKRKRTKFSFWIVKTMFDSSWLLFV